MKQTIDIPGLPEGWRAVAYRLPKKGERCWLPGFTKIMESGMNYNDVHWFIVEKIQPRRIVLEETDEDNGRDTTNQYYAQHFDTIGVVLPNKSKIWRQVKDGE